MFFYFSGKEEVKQAGIAEGLTESRTGKEIVTDNKMPAPSGLLCIGPAEK
jgi:hypothetical protein